MSCWSGQIAYDPPDNPHIGGYAATFNAFERAIGRSHAIEATKRVVRAWPDVKTGDPAFDERADAFRTALMAGTPEAYRESPAAFAATGLLNLSPEMY
jgi:hypothetical protein